MTHWSEAVSRDVPVAWPSVAIVPDACMEGLPRFLLRALLRAGFSPEGREGPPFDFFSCTELFFFLLTDKGFGFPVRWRFLVAGCCRSLSKMEISNGFGRSLFCSICERHY